jgi:hypothetical protein
MPWPVNPLVVRGVAADLRGPKNETWKQKEAPVSGNGRVESADVGRMVIQVTSYFFAPFHLIDSNFEAWIF